MLYFFNGGRIANNIPKKNSQILENIIKKEKDSFLDVKTRAKTIPNKIRAFTRVIILLRNSLLRKINTNGKII